MGASIQKYDDVFKAIGRIFTLEDLTKKMFGEEEGDEDTDIPAFEKDLDAFVLDMWDENPKKIQEKFLEFVQNAYWGAE